MNEVGKGQFCRAEGGLLLPLLFAGKQSEGHGYELEESWNAASVLFVWKAEQNIGVNSICNYC